MMIPKKIHLCWLSGDKYPELIMRCIDSWKKYLPDYEIVLWDRHKINMSNIPWVAEAYEAKKYAFAADYIRLYAVYNEGGIYLDSDVEVIGSFDAMLNAKSFIGIERGGDFEAAVIGAQPKCEWLKECLKYYDNRHFVKPDGNYDLCPLPVIVGKVLMDVYKIKPQTDEHVKTYDHPSLVVYPSEYFSPKSVHSHKIYKTSRTVAIHHFDGAWSEKGWSYKIKIWIHNCLIFAFGQKIHNRIVVKAREWREMCNL